MFGRPAVLGWQQLCCLKKVHNYMQLLFSSPNHANLCAQGQNHDQMDAI